MSTITLGYEMKTGREVRIPIRHTAVTGQSQESGKTTTLEALIARSGLRAVAFVTKRGERSFISARVIAPYFREPQCTIEEPMWQYVTAILRATLKQNMKFQESWIMTVCDSRDAKNGKWERARTLKDVAANIEIALQKARGLNESVYTQLREYLRIVLPQIDRLPKSDRLDLKPGINCMTLTDYTPEMQALVIRSVVEWLTEHEDKTIVIIPEAWQFIPQGRGSPVLAACERLIRQGAGLENYIWLDSQDIAGVDADIRKQVAVWILGVQRADMEVKRTLEHIPRPRPTSDQIMRLGRGQFYACFGETIKHVYVQPIWMDAGQAQLIAFTGDKPPAAPALAAQSLERKEEEMYREKFEESQSQLAIAQTQIKTLTDELERQKRINTEQFDRLSQACATLPKSEAEKSQQPDHGPRLAPLPFDGTLFQSDFEKIYQYVLSRIKEDPAVLAILKAKPTIRVDVVEHTLELDGKGLAGKIALLIHDGFFVAPTNLTQTVNELRRLGSNPSFSAVLAQLKKFTRQGFLVKEADKTYMAVKGMRVEKT